MIENIKPLYQAALRPVVRLCARFGIHPNAVTGFGVIIFAGVGVLCAIGHWKLACAAFVIGACMDGIDGQLAREYGKKTVFGAVFDSTCDRVTEIFWILGLLYYYITASQFVVVGAMLCGAALSGSLMVSYVRARCEGAGIECKEGLFQRPERIIALGICLLFGPVVMLWGLGLVAGLAWVTVGQRVVVAKKKSESGLAG